MNLPSQSLVDTPILNAQKVVEVLYGIEVDGTLDVTSLALLIDNTHLTEIVQHTVHGRNADGVAYAQLLGRQHASTTLHVLLDDGGHHLKLLVGEIENEHSRDDRDMSSELGFEDRLSNYLVFDLWKSNVHVLNTFRLESDFLGRFFLSPFHKVLI